MTINYFTQMIIAAFFFMLFSFCAWYEGSEILDNSWEWKHSTYFSEHVIDADDISDLDHFVYAAKFRPLFPVLMILTASYIIILTGHRLFKKSITKKAVFLSGFGALFLFASGIVSNSPTIGGGIFQAIFLIGGMLLILAAALCYFWLPRGFKTER
ncbi:DUF4306 domain-containing protein [Peribacillus sp. FSL E2-0218]|uniref:DUF4306 domain-containing protein n=1 Tax=Peribacillus sp. FSL E2-0218 TaxID=2921364 RepID=UPI0030EF43AD